MAAEPRTGMAQPVLKRTYVLPALVAAVGVVGVYLVLTGFTVTLESRLAFWLAFNAVIVFMLALDLGVINRKAHVIYMREAAAWVMAWITVSLGFNAAVYSFLGVQKALDFFTAYLIEYSLSVDNLFVFLVIFNYFNTPDSLQPRVLKWGIIGAIVMRALIIFAGASFLETFRWGIYVFGAILLATGMRLIIEKEHKVRPERNVAVRLFRKFMPVTAEYHGQKFFVKKSGPRYLTPLFIALLVVETTDLVFATDSIPAVLAISTDTFIVYTSNAFAILGLRALYFVLRGAFVKFHYLKPGLSLILVFIAIKMLLSDVYRIPTEYALSVVGSVLVVSLIASFIIRPSSRNLGTTAHSK